MPTRKEIREAIIRANKLGARGIQVIEYIEPQCATAEPILLLVTQIPVLQGAAEKVWYD